MAHPLFISENHSFIATDCTKKIHPLGQNHTLSKRKSFNFEAFLSHPSLREESDMQY